MIRQHTIRFTLLSALAAVGLFVVAGPARALNFEITPLTNNSTDDIGSQISSDLIAWVNIDPVDGDQEVYYYDIATEVSTRLTFNDLHDSIPVLSGGNMAWQVAETNTAEDPTSTYSMKLGPVV